MLRQVIGEDASDPTSELVLRLLLLLTSPLVALYWKDYLGLTTAEAATTAAWGIRTLVAHRGMVPTARVFDDAQPTRDLHSSTSDV